MADRNWDGKAVRFRAPGLGTMFDRKPYHICTTEDGARKLALALAKLKQTTMMLPPEVAELHDALNYVLVGDPASTAAHSKMEAGKGMTPDGGL